MKLGIFTVSTPDYTPEETIRIASKIGYDGLEWRITEDKGDRDHPSFWSGNRTSMTAEDLLKKAKSLKSLAKKCHMEMPSLAAYICCSELERAEKTFEAAQKLGAHTVRVNALSFTGTESYKKVFSDTRKFYKKIAGIAKKYGVRAVIETHMGQIAPTVTAARSILEGLDPESVGIMWDPGNQVTEGRERYDLAVSCAGEYLAEVHIKNAMLTPLINRDGTLEWKTENCQIQSGFVNWPAVIRELKKAGYNGWLMFEDFSTVQPLEERITANYRYMKALIC